jgi:hypothetical protein
MTDQVEIEKLLEESLEKKVDIFVSFFVPNKTQYY